MRDEAEEDEVESDDDDGDNWASEMRAALKRGAAIAEVEGGNQHGWCCCCRCKAKSWSADVAWRWN